MTVLYFAFGSNLDAEQMEQRCPGSRVRFRARLDAHRIAFSHLSRRWRGGAADVIPDPAARVWGVVYALQTDHFPALDAYEAGYDRVQLDVRDDADALHRVTTYQVRERGDFAPSREYLTKMLDWGVRWELPADYLEALRAIRTCD